MDFAVDCMLGKLAKWLKILGFDTLYFNRIEDEDLFRLAQQENRTLLTRDRALLRRKREFPALLISSDDWKDQLRQVVREYKLREQIKPYTRCVECNLPIKMISAGNAKNLVSPYIFKTAAYFSLCPRCGRVYWRGTHHHDMADKINRLLDGLNMIPIRNGSAQNNERKTVGDSPLRPEE